MLFITVGRARGTCDQHDVMARRMQYQFPDGLRVLGEYWPQAGDPAVILVSEADDIGPLLAATSFWADAYDFTSFPAVTAEEGMGLAMGRLADQKDASLTVEPVEAATR